VSDEPIQDAEVVSEEDVSPVPVQEAPSTQLVRRERRSVVIRPLDPEALVESFQAYQDLLPKLLDKDDLQDAGGGKQFVKKSGWRKIATAFDLDVQMIRSQVERDGNGQPVRAEVWARAVAPSGRSMDGDGYCSVDESRFSGPRGNKSKLENDLRATATTRAMNRAISGLVGMGAVSAEEIDAPTPAQPGPPYGPVATDEKIARCRRALVWALKVEENSTAIDAVLAKLQNVCDGYLSMVAVDSAGVCIAALKAAESASREPPPAGSINPPVLEGQSIEADLAKLRDAGCVCPDPYASGSADGSRPGIDDACPIRGHGIPF
jgi:hypothetical protein